MPKLWESAMLDTFYFRILLALVGIALFVFYVILFTGAVVNLPVSWFGVVYSGFGIAASVACFMYFFTKRGVLFLLIVPALALMILTLLGVRR